MYAGQIVEKAPALSLFSAVRMPYTEALLNSIPKLSDPSHTRLQAIGGRPPDLINPPTGCRFSPRCPYVQDKCREEMPPLIEDAPGHQYRCWFPVDVSVAVPEPAEPSGRRLRRGRGRLDQAAPSRSCSSHGPRRGGSD